MATISGKDQAETLYDGFQNACRDFCLTFN